MNPIDHLVKEMINRGRLSSRDDDIARFFVISKIPNFVDTVKSIDYLTSFAERYFEKNDKKSAIIEVFNNSLVSEEFQKDLQVVPPSTADYFWNADDYLRIVLRIFPLSQKKEKYWSPNLGR